MSQLVACNPLFSITYHLWRTARHTSAGSESSSCELAVWTIWTGNETGNRAWMHLSISKMDCSNRYCQHKQLGGTFNTNAPRRNLVCRSSWVMQKQKAAETHCRCWICERLLSVYWKNPYNHRKTLNWLFGVVYLHAGKPAKMITGRRTLFFLM